MSKKRIGVMIAFLFMVIMLVPNVAYADTKVSSTAGDFAMYDFAVSEGENSITYSCKVESKYPIQNASMQVQMGLGGEMEAASFIIEEESVSDMYIYDISSTVSTNYNGTWNVKSIKASDSQGNTFAVYNSTVMGESDFEGWSFYDLKGTDLSALDVEIGAGITDTTPPEIDVNNIIVSKEFTFSSELQSITECSTTDMLYVYVPVSDDTGLASVNAMFYGTNMECNVTGNSVSDGYYCFSCLASEFGNGTFGIATISAVDSSANEIKVVNSNYENATIYDGINADLSGYNVTIAGTNANDTSAPIVDVSTLKVVNSLGEQQEKYVLKEQARVILQIQDESKISKVDAVFKYGKYGNVGGGFFINPLSQSYDSATDMYTYTMYADLNTVESYYGTWKIDELYVVDENGNSTHYMSEDFSQSNPYGYISNTAYEVVDMSSANFDVGIFDKNNTGVFISGDEMEEGVTMEVEEISKDEEEYLEMADDVDNVITCIDISVNDKHGKGVKVQIPVDTSKYPDGTKVKIKHKNMQNGGKIDVLQGVVTNGVACIVVDSFSPFMVEFDINNANDNTDDVVNNTDDKTDETVKNDTDDKTDETVKNDDKTDETAKSDTDDTVKTDETSDGKTSDTPKTGDNTPVEGLFLLMVISCLGIELLRNKNKSRI